MCAVKWDKNRKLRRHGVNGMVQERKHILLSITAHKTHIVTSEFNLSDSFLLFWWESDSLRSVSKAFTIATKFHGCWMCWWAWNFRHILFHTKSLNEIHKICLYTLSNGMAQLRVREKELKILNGTSNVRWFKFTFYLQGLWIGDVKMK